MLKIFEQLFPDKLYHSYVIEGNPQFLANELLSFLQIRGEIEKQSQDVICQMYESFTIEDSRAIKDWHNKLGITSGKRICILATKFINKEAEQALLKIIEEPGINTHFFIIIPDSSILLPTIISRVQIIKINKFENEEIIKEVSTFIKSTSNIRIEMIAKIIKDHKDQEGGGQLRSYAIVFVNELEKFYYQKFKDKKDDKETIFILEELQKSRNYLNTHGASVKMILEHLALVI